MPFHQHPKKLLEAVLEIEVGTAEIKLKAVTSSLSSPCSRMRDARVLIFHGLSTLL